MKATNSLWFGVLIMANLAVVASSGTIVLDALATILMGHVTIGVWTGNRLPLVNAKQSTWGQFLHLVVADLKLKLGGVLLLLSTALMLLPFSWEMLIKFILAILAIELIALLIQECVFRTRTLGNIAIIAGLMLIFLSIHLCSGEIAGFLIHEKLPSRLNTSWTKVFVHWSYTSAILIGSTLASLGLLRAHPKRNERLTKPRLWLFA